MPSRADVFQEIDKVENPLDAVRKKYLNAVHEYTRRNVITYYSAFLQKSGHSKTSIDDNDKNAFMQAVYGLDKTLGLDLILHTPGGNLAAAESIVVYLKSIFGNNIRVIIPQIAMSAGTMIALSAKEIIMGKQSNLGPIDPQFGGMSCAGIIEEFKTACDDVNRNPNLARLWSLIIGKYHPTFLGDCKNAVNWSEKMVTTWLKENMFKDDADKCTKVERIVSFLSSHSETFSHQKHIHMVELQGLGLKVIPLEGLDNRAIGSCKDFQDCVLTLHHSYMHTLANSNVLKIVENQKFSGLAFTSFAK